MKLKLCPLLVSILLCACGGIPKPKNFDDSPEPLLASIEERGAALKSLSANLKVDVWRESERVKVSQLIAVDAVGRLRIEVLSPFGSPLITLASDGSRLMIYDAKEGRFFLGPASADALGRLLPVELSPPELSNLLRGAIPMIEYTDSKVDWNRETGRYQLTLTGPERIQEIEFEPEFLRVTQFEIRHTGSVLYTVRLGDYSGTGSAIVPKRIRFTVPSKNLRVDLSVTEVTLNPPIPDTTFTLTPPRGILVEPL